MHRTRRIVPALIVVAALSLIGAGKRSHVLEGKVIHVADGDTITVLDAKNKEHKIRLLDIDAPEVGHGKGEPAQPFGTKSKEYLESLLAREENVRVVWHEHDPYKRLLGDVYVGGGWVNREMIRAGFAWHYSHFDKRQELEKIEIQAREARRGLWADKNPTPPWEWRKEEREAKNAR